MTGHPISPQATAGDAYCLAPAGRTVWELHNLHARLRRCPLAKQKEEAYVDLRRTPKVCVDISDAGDSLLIQYRSPSASPKDLEVYQELPIRDEADIPSPGARLEACSPYDDLEDKRRHLRKTLCDRFSQEELRTLCFDLCIDYDNLSGEGKEAKARELVAYLERRGELEHLIAAVRRERGDII